MIRKVFVFSAMLMMAISIWAAHEVAAPQNIFARESMSLNGDWHYFADPQEQGYYDYWMNPVRWGYFLNAKPQRPSDLIEYDLDASPTMQVPGDWNTQDERLFMYEGTVWFLRKWTMENAQWTNLNSQSIANETPHGEARDRFLSRLATQTRSQDSTRLISMAMEVLSASNYVNRLQDNMNKYVDVVSFNQYVGWYRDVHDAPHMRWEIPYDKPVIVSEFGGGAKAGLHGDVDQRWTEEFQERLYCENLAMLEKIDGLAGTCPWVLKDFRSQRRLLPGIQDLYNRKGLYSDQGQRKKASYVLQEWYGRRQ